MYTMLILSGDIKLNPGPVASIYPCGLYDRKVDWDDRGVAGDSCDIWYHCSCISMQSSEYSRLNSTTENWKCYRCDFTFPDHSLYHSYNVDVSNSFSLLAGPMFNDSVFSASPSPGFQPRSHSSPLLDGFPTFASSRPTSGSHSQNSARSTSQLLPPNKSGDFRFLTTILTVTV